MSYVKYLHDKNLIKPPKFLPDNVQYETIMGSVSYGCSDDMSDVDIYGFCIPPKDDVFPHLRGEIVGFGRQKNRFEQWQEHHVEAKCDERQYDFAIFNIVKYFSLCMENNPNMIDSLYTPQRCVTHLTHVGNMVRENRDMFLHKGSWHKFKGYAFSQMHKMKIKNPEGNRKELVEKYGYDVKFGYHVVRLLNEVEQILIEGTIDLEKNREQLKSIRRGEWKLEDIENYFNRKERDLETLYTNSKLRYSPDEEKIRQLLLSCLEHHYGSLDKCVTNLGKAEVQLLKIKEILEA